MGKPPGSAGFCWKKRSRTALRLPRGKALRGVFIGLQIALLLYASGAQFVFAQETDAAPATVPAADAVPQLAPPPAQDESAGPVSAETVSGEQGAASEPDPLPEPSQAEGEGRGEGEGGEGGGGGEPDTPPAPPYSSVQPTPASYQIKPEVDQSTGALTYRYPLTLPPGRNGMTPELSLAYNSQDTREGSPAGFGWNLSLPSIDRQNLTGIRNLFTADRFTSSLSGELVRTAAGSVPNNFAARVDDGSMLQYTFANSAWIVRAKDGTSYSFGAAPASRVFDLANDPSGAKVARWLLDRIEDTNGSRINFSYIRDLNQLYLDTVSYTDTAAGAGPFLVTFLRELRPDADRHISYAQGFRTETRYRVNEIRASVSGQLAVKYALAYTQSPVNNRSLLASITQTGYDAFGAPTVLPPTAFAYTPSNMGFVQASPSPFSTVTVPQPQGSSLRHGFLIADVNGDAYADLVRSYEYNDQNPSANFVDRRVWLNDHAGSLIESTTWTGTSTLPFICTDTEALNCVGHGVMVSDTNGDLLADYYRASGGNADLGINVGGSWNFTSISSAYSILPTYFYRPSTAAYDGANPPYTIEVSSSNGVGVSNNFGTQDNFGNRVADVNHDGLPDVVRSIGHPTETNGLDERVYLGSGIDPVTGIIHFEQIGWQFLNGANVGANAAAANAVFEHTSPKEAFLADVNGDDLPDAVRNGTAIYRHAGNTWVLGSTPFSFTDPHDGTDVADLNGDGLLDLVASDMCGLSYPAACRIRVFYNTGQVPDLLKTIMLPAGGAVTAAYQASSRYKDASGNLLNPNLAMAIQTVERITETDPVTGVSGATVYEYAGGKYFFESLMNRRFAGFREVRAVKPDGSKTAAYFNVTDDGKIGKPERTDVLDAGGVLVKRTLTSYTTTPFSALAASRFLTVPDAAIAMDFGAALTHRDRAARSTYDTGTGALLQQTDYGEVTVPDPLTPVFTDLGTDARASVYTYATDPTGVLELPATQTLTDFAGATAAQTRTYYDTLPLGGASIGNRTKEERLLDTVAGTYAATQRTYTGTGLVQTETDPLNHTTQFTYDTLGLYPATVANALNQQTAYTYDYTSGKPITVTDPNGELRTTVYDGVDRVIEEWKPHPATGASVMTHTVSYTDAPSQTAVHEQFVNGGSPLVNTHAIDLEDSSSQYLFAANSSPFSITGSMTIEAWVKPESAPTDGNDFVIASKSSSAGGRSYYFYYHNTAGVFSLRFAASPNGITTPSGSVNIALAVGMWTHVAAVYTASAQSVEFFVNGMSAGTASGLPASIFNGSGEFDVGARFTGGGHEAFFDGLIDDVRVWNTAQLPAAIAASVQGQLAGNVANLVGRWKLDNDFLDASGNGNMLSNPAFAPFSADVPYGGAAPVVIVGESYLYLDGFGRPVQERKRSEGTGAGGLPAFTAQDTRYDGNGRVQNVSLPYASSGAARTQAATNPIINTAYQYDAAGRVASVADAVGTTATAYDRWDSTVTDPNGHQKKFGRDAFGQLTRVEEFPTGAPPAAVTSYAYDVSGNLTNITDADGNVRRFTYDSRGLRRTAEDLHALASDDAADAPTFGVYAFAYDAAGNLTEQQTSAGDTIVYSYDALNRPLAENFLGASGTEVAYTYDTCSHGIGRRCSETRSGWSRALTYDLAGNAAAETVTVGGIAYPTSYAYDQLGNVTRVTHPDGSATISTLNESGKTETVSRQASAGAPPALLVANLDYAPHGAVAKISRPNGLEETFLYDTAAKYRLAEHVVGLAGSGALPGIPNTHAIDLEDSSSQYLFAANSSPFSITGSMTIEAWVKPESAPTDGNDFVVASKSSSAGGRSYYFYYHNTAGVFSLRFAASSNGTATVAGSVNRILPVGAWTHVASVYAAAAQSVEFFVNGASIGTASGLPASIFNGSGEFDVGARFTGGGHEAFFDGLIDDVRVWNTVRDPWSIGQSMQGQVVGDTSYLKAHWKLDSDLVDASGNNNTLSNPANASFVTDVPWMSGPTPLPALSRRAYTYDPVGNVLSVVEAVAGATTTSAYTYDPLDRLLSATVDAQTTTGTTQTVSSYTYGPTGNLLTSPSGSYAYSGFSGAYVNPHAATSVGNRTLAYDQNGNLVSDAGGAATVANSWSYRNELMSTAITASGSQTSVSYGYDSSGKRVSLAETAAGLTTTTRFPTPSYSETTKPDGTIERTVSIEVAGIPVATIRTVGSSTPETFATHTDHLRSIRLATDQTGAVVESTDYDPFGKITNHTQSGTFTERKKFTSHEFDSATNYTYAKARYLDTEVGRFISEDPKFIRNPEQFLEDPQQQNSYTYARNNPIKYVDPDGESATFFGALAGAAYGLGYSIGSGATSWKAFAQNIITGATVGALVGSVIDTGGLSAPAVVSILAARGVADAGVDAVDFADKVLLNPEQYSSQEKAGVSVELGIDALGLIPGVRILSEAQKSSLNVLDATIDVLDQYFGEKVYQNANDKYKNSATGGTNLPYRGSLGGTFSGSININPGSFPPGSLQGQLQQLQSQLEQIQQIINGLQP